MNPSTVQRIIATTAAAWMLAAGAQAQPPSSADWPFPRGGSTTALRNRLRAQFGLDAQGNPRAAEARSRSSRG